MIFEVETSLIGPDLERGLRNPTNGTNGDGVDYILQQSHGDFVFEVVYVYGKLSTYIYIHEYVFYICQQSDSRSEVIKGDNEFKIFMRNLGPYLSLEM